MTLVKTNIKTKKTKEILELHSQGLDVQSIVDKLGSNCFICSLGEVMVNYGIKCSIHLHRSEKFSILYVSGALSLNKLFELMYMDCGELFMVRKYEKFKKYN